MDLFSALQILALRDVLAFRRNSEVKEDAEYPLRRIFRWYSKTFHTPLHLVDDLPVEDVVRAYWESHYEDQDDDQLEIARVDLMKTDEERAAEALAADENEAEDTELIEAIRAVQAATGAATDAIEKVKLEKKAPLLPLDPAVLRDVEMIPATSLGAAPLPEISMTFAADDEDLGLEEDTFGLLERPR